MTPQALYQWLVELIGAWPETKVTMTWGEPHFRVGDKIFSGYGAHKDGRYAMSAKLDKDKQAALVASDPRFQIAPYVGKHGWVAFYPGDEPDLGELEALLMESYRNVAPKKLAEALGAAQPAKAKLKAARKPAQPAKPAASAKRTAKAKPVSKAKKPAKPASKLEARNGNTAAPRRAAVKATTTGRAAAGRATSKRVAVKASSSKRAAPKADAKRTGAKPKR